MRERLVAEARLRLPPLSAQRRATASIARAERSVARFFEKAFDTSRRLPYIAAADGASAFERIRGPRGFRANSSSSLPCRKAGAERFARLPEGESDEIEHDGDFSRRMRREGVVEFRGFGLDCYLTIASEGRETWAAGSLRGFVVWAGLA